MRPQAIRVSIVLHLALVRRNILQLIPTRAFRQRARERESTLTYDELIVAIDDAAPKLSEASLRLLLRLVSLAIQTGSSEIRASHEWLAVQLGMSEEGIARGKRGLAGIVCVEGGHRVTTNYVLPADWFAPQRSLFAVSTGQLPRPVWPTNQARSGQPTRPALPNEPGQITQPTRPAWPTNQASYPTNQASLPHEPGQSGQPTRPVLVKNQQLTDAADQIRSDQRFTSGDELCATINQITHSIHIQPGQEQDAEVLRDHMREFMRAYGARGIPPAGPHTSTLSRCLAIAPLETLLSKLPGMAEKKRGHPREWIWFLLLFAQDILGIEKEPLLDSIKAFNKRKPPAAQTADHFKQELLNTATAGSRRMQ